MRIAKDEPPAQVTAGTSKERCTDGSYMAREGTVNSAHLKKLKMQHKLQPIAFVCQSADGLCPTPSLATTK